MAATRTVIRSSSAARPPELSIPCITAMDTARVLVDALRGDHDISQMELVDIAHLHREAAKGE